MEGYRSILDPASGELAPYLLSLYYKVIEQCLLKHSKRPYNDEVRLCWGYKSGVIEIIVYTGNEMVAGNKLLK